MFEFTFVAFVVIVDACGRLDLGILFFIEVHILDRILHGDKLGKIVDGKVIFSLPTFEVHEETRKQKEMASRAPVVDKALLQKSLKIYFDAGKSDLKGQYNSQLDAILADLNKNQALGVEISGFASAEGSDDMNRDLSNKRAISVLDYLNHKGVVRRRIVAKGYGASKDVASTKEEGRRVEVRIVDLNDLQVRQ